MGTVEDVIARALTKRSHNIGSPVIWSEHNEMILNISHALREAGKVREWEPIETAPKDETVILIAMRNDYGEGAFSVRSGWWMNTGCRPDWSCCISSQKPTHWMPLPPLPEGEK